MIETIERLTLIGTEELTEFVSPQYEEDPHTEYEDEDNDESNYKEFEN